MKSGGPWNLRGLRPETREAARDAARRSGMSVGEWLNSVIQQGDEGYDEPPRYADYDDDRDDGWRQDSRHESRRDSRHEYRRDPREESREPLYREPRREGGSSSDRRRRAERDREHEREVARARDDSRETARLREEIREVARARDESREAARLREELRDVARAREEFGDVHARLDKLSHQLERMTQTEAPRLTGAPVQPQRRSPPAGPPRAGNRSPAHGASLTIDAAVAEIAERQRTLDGGAPRRQRQRWCRKWQWRPSMPLESPK